MIKLLKILKIIKNNQTFSCLQNVLKLDWLNWKIVSRRLYGWQQVYSHKGPVQITKLVIALTKQQINLRWKSHNSQQPLWELSRKPPKLHRKRGFTLTGFQTITVLSKELDANFCPSDVKQQWLTGPLWPRSSCNFSRQRPENNWRIM